MDNILKILPPKKQHSPKDNLLYVLPQDIISSTERILSEYGRRRPPHEGLVYWGGKEESGRITVSTLIAPKTDSDYGRVSTSCRSNFDVVRVLNKYKGIQVAQVHSHPGTWVDHSFGDDELAAFKVNGLLSVVVPSYCYRGMLPLASCGVHRYANGEFIRLSPDYVRRHFRIENSDSAVFEDLRHG